jgi:predicted dehydrogenase
VSVNAIVGTYFNGHEPAYRADDGSLLFIRFDTGQVATVHLTGYYQGIRDGFSEYCCQKGMLKYTGQQILTTNPEDPEDYEYHEVPVEGGMGFVPQMADMVGAVRTGRSPAVPGEWGRLVMQVLLGAEQSARSGREIRLDG